MKICFFSWMGMIMAIDEWADRLLGEDRAGRKI
jgi:hypothetical protein